MRKIILGLVVLTTALAGPADAADTRTFNIPPGDLAPALESLAKETGLELIFQPEELKGVRTRGVSGTLSPREAVAKLIDGTRLVIKTDSAGAILICGEAQARKTSRAARTSPMRLAESGAPSQGADGPPSASVAESGTAQSADEKGIPEMLVKGQRSLNSDIRRTEDDPQPYVIFDAEDIQRSQALNLDDFLRTRLPMNTAAGTASQNTPGEAKTASSINLRGLGAHQTLVLVDGRRMPGFTEFSGLAQPDINGIPLAAIERIEVLPSTAGGIYGGGATGGVINIILRRDFTGVDSQVNYVNTFDTDASVLRVDLNSGFSLEGGRTRITISGSHSNANTLTTGDRDFAERGIALQYRNNPLEIIGYPTPPLGRTTNVRSADGVPLTLKGGGALGSQITHIPPGYRGVSSDNGAALIANAGSYDIELSNDMIGGRRGIMSSPSISTLTANLRREFGERIDAFVDAGTFANKGITYGGGGLPSTFLMLSSAPTNPFNQNIYVSLPNPGWAFESRSESKTQRVSGGLIVRLAHRWTAGVDYNWSLSRYLNERTGSAVDTGAGAALRTGLAQNGRPALNPFIDANTTPTNYFPYLLPDPNNITGPSRSVLKHGALRLSGPTLDILGGPVNLSALLEHREETAKANFFQNINTTSRSPTFVYYPERRQQVSSAYLEARMPVFSARNALPGVRELELQLSARRDEYEVTSDGSIGFQVPSRNGPFPARTYFTNELGSTDYTLGLRYVPIEDVALRASFSTGFVPPSILQVAPNRLVGLGFNLGSGDPERGFEPTGVNGQEVTLISGGNPTLRPEESESWSAGVVFTPRFARGLRVSLDYTRIEKTDEIIQPDVNFLLSNAELFPGRIERYAPLANDVYDVGPIRYFDLSLLNVAKSRVDAWDLRVDCSLGATRFGDFSAFALATYQPHYKQQPVPSAELIDTVGFTSGPLEKRGNLGLNWDKGPLSVSWNMQYYDSYRIYTAFEDPFLIDYYVANQGSHSVPGQSYHDVIATYRFGAMSGYGAAFDNSEIALGIQNVFDTSPPILAVFDGTTPAYSTYGDPRLRRYSVSFRKSFGR